MQYLLVSLLLIINLGGHKIFANTEDVQQKIALLKEKINTTNDKEYKLELIGDLFNTDFSATRNIYWYKLQASLADSLGYDKAKIKAYANISRIYFNNEKKDSLFYWIDKTAEACRKADNYEYYFDTRIFGCMWYIRNKNFSMATNMVKTLQEEAEEKNSYEGRVSCCQALGMINHQTNNREKAISSLEEGIALLEFLPHRNPLKCQMYLYLLMVAFDGNDIDKKEKIMNGFASFLEEEEARPKPTFASSKAKWYNYYYHFLFHLQQKNIDSTRFYFKKTEEYSRNLSNYNIDKYHYDKSQYYELEGNYEKSLEEINKAIDMSPSRGAEIYLKQKGDVYSKMGKHDMAYTQYCMAQDHLVQTWKDLHAKEFNVLKERSDLFYAQMEKSELEIKSSRNSIRRMCICLCILVILLAIIIILLINVNKYKKKLALSTEALKNEKERLETIKEHLEEMLSKAEESNKKKNAFLASMSHEIRTPLNSIIGFSELIVEEEYGTNEEKEFASIIQSNSYLLLKLVNDIVNQSRMESETISIELEKADIIKCARNAVQSIGKLIGNDVRINFTSDFEELIIDTDIFRFQQILTNLLGNAAKFTEKGNIYLDITRAEGYLKFSVSDTGCGIPADKHQSVFLKYEKLNENICGTGLGLWICQAITEKLKGRIYIDSSYMDGARFVFEHPIKY